MAERKNLQVMVLCGAILVPGIASFILGVLAENAKPTDINLVSDGATTVCSYPKDSTPALGSAAVVFLFVSFLVAISSLIYPYDGKGVPLRALYKSAGLVVFVLLAVAIFFTAEGLMLWATVEQRVARRNPVHVGQLSACPGAKAGLFGGAAFLALDATLFWLICVMLALNARAAYLYDGEDDKGVYGELPMQFRATVTVSPNA